MFESSLKLGSVFGIRILVHYTWVIVFMLLSSSLYYVFLDQYPQWSNGLSMLTAVATSILFFISIVLHELGHSLVALSRGIRVRSIVLFIFGGMAQTEKEADTPAAEFWIAVAGPLVSLALAAMFYGLSQLFERESQAIAASFDWLASINFLVAVFNMIPGFPLDGGRVFRALVWGLSGDTRKGMRWAVLSGKVVAFGLMTFGLLIVMQTGQVFTGVWMLGIGWFLLAAAEASAQGFTINRLLSHMTVSECMRHDVPFVEPQTSIIDWLNEQVLPSGRRAYLVREEGHVIGLVAMSDCSKLPREHWSSATVRDVMTPKHRLHSVTPETDLAEVLRNMGFHSINQVPVVDGNKVIGWIDRGRIMKVLHSHYQNYSK
jgi:Zn-dependent protease/predicted transcriptional regulator